MKILRINHLGIAPKAPEQAKTFLGSILGLPLAGSEIDPRKVFACSGALGAIPR